MQLPSALRALLDRPEPARSLGRFALVRQLGRGGFAPVWLARESYGDVELRRVAIKLFAFDALDPSPGGAPDDPRRARVIEEARLLCKVEHLNIVRFHQLLVDEEPGVLGLVMEHIDGPSLEERLRRERRLAIDEVLAIGASVASALAAVHRAGLVHRDVKPANLVEAHGVIKLIDFGIALRRRRTGEGNARGQARVELPDFGPEALGAEMSILASSIAPSRGATPEVDELPSGTVGYIDPVCVAEGAPAAPASDLYALGATLYQCLTGLLPSVAAAGPSGGLRGEVLDGRAAPPPVTDLAPEAPAELCRMVDALLAPDREARPATAERVAATLEQLRAQRAGAGSVALQEGGRGVNPLDEAAAEALARYLDYIAVECSELQLDGLPADQEVGARRLRLERLFVPLKLVPAAPEDAEEQGDLLAAAVVSPPPEAAGRFPLGQMLAEHPRVAVLGSPGAGKSTVLNVLAVAYAFPERRPVLDEELPDRRWLPLLVRCRDLGERASQGMTAVLRSLAERALLTADQASALMLLLERALRAGEVLLLVDGLDEIADDRHRRTFAKGLRTFLSLYPSVSAVITSREAGFRAVAGTLAASCRTFTLAELDREDIRRLTLAWFRQMLGDRPAVLADAEALAQAITSNDRILILAKNPLLLMTLLLVNRWLGQLPTRRAVLYDKAIEVLLTTWNVEAHGKLDGEEILPQLAFLAFSMMEQGIQRITAPELSRILHEARRQMPDLLGYARLGVGELIDRVEYRSSLLIRSGKRVMDGKLCELYEFRHLTFQEHLAALAAARRYYPRQKEGDTLVTVLGGHLAEDAWREVIPLAATLAGRDARLLVEALIDRCASHGPSQPFEHPDASLLWRCILDEVPLAPRTVERALLALLRAGLGGSRWLDVARGRYQEALWDLLQARWRELPEAFSYMQCLAAVSGERIGITWDTGIDEVEPSVRALLESELPFERIAGTAVIGWLTGVHAGARAQEIRSEQELPPWRPAFLSLILDAIQLLEDGDDGGEPLVQYNLCAGLAMACMSSAAHREAAVAVLPRLAELWSTSDYREIRGAAGALIMLLFTPTRAAPPARAPTPEILDAIRTAAESESLRQQEVALILAYLWRQPWTDQELSARVTALRPRFERLPWNWANKMLGALSRRAGL